MKHPLRFVLTVVFAALLSCSAGAQIFFTGSPSFTITPFTQSPLNQVNPVGLGLVLTPIANGFSVSGQVQVPVPAGPSSGTLLSWTAEYQIDTSLTPVQTATTTINYSGFINAPVGNGAALGQVSTQIPGVAGSFAAPPAFAHSGPGVFPYGLTASSSFAYTPAGVQVLRQTYSVDYNYNGGTGGTYVLDFPVDSTAVPEPTTALLLALGAPLLLSSTSRRER